VVRACSFLQFSLNLREKASVAGLHIILPLREAGLTQGASNEVPLALLSGREKSSAAASLRINLLNEAMPQGKLGPNSTSGFKKNS